MLMCPVLESTKCADWRAEHRTAHSGHSAAARGPTPAQPQGPGSFCPGAQGTSAFFAVFRIRFYFLYGYLRIQDFDDLKFKKKLQLKTNILFEQKLQFFFY
jgi:hypothetical protein